MKRGWFLSLLGSLPFVRPVSARAAVIADPTAHVSNQVEVMEVWRRDEPDAVTVYAAGALVGKFTRAERGWSHG